MFKFLKISVEEKIKQEPYIESANVKRKLDGTIEIQVLERVATYMLVLENQYAYINNQGYILEISETKLEVPTITGVITESIEPGKRLEEKDLLKLDTVIQIIKTANEKGLENKITNINIENDRCIRHAHFDTKIFKQMFRSKVSNGKKKITFETQYIAYHMNIHFQ